MTELLKAARRGQWSNIKLLLKRHQRAACSKDGTFRRIERGEERRRSRRERRRSAGGGRSSAGSPEG